MKQRFKLLLLFQLMCFQGLFAQSTWSTIQDNVLTPNCTTCHYSGSSFAIQSGLVLTADSSYEQLVNAMPKNSAARNDALLRVHPSGGQPGLEQSFLWEKIDVTNQDHYYNDHPNYGALMPLGLPSLTNGQLAFIKEWILAGAPDNGVVADPALLDDTTRYEPPPFIALNPPAQGIQLHLGPFDVWPSQLHDREFFYYEPYPTTEELYVKRYEISYRPGSHHFILYNYPTVGGPSFTPTPNTYRDMRNAQGIPNFGVLNQSNELFPFYFFVGTQVPYANYYFPPNVALRLPPNRGFDLNSHSVNRSDTTTIGEVYVNLHTVDLSEIDHIADYGNFGNFDLALPPNQVTTVSKTFTFNEQRHIIQMWTHAHEHMTEFRVERASGPNNGELLYWTNDWAHPPLLQLDPPLTFEAGDKIKMVTTYNNWTNDWIYFGPLSSDEMQFIFYVYFTGNLTGIEENEQKIEGFHLAQNYPNPFNPTTRIDYQLETAADVALDIVNMRGQIVRRLVGEHQSAGQQQAVWDGKDGNGRLVSSGIYLYRLRAADFVQSKKMVLMR